MPDYGIMAVHAEPYVARQDEAFPETNLLWDRTAGRITVRYCTLPDAKQINEVSVLLSEIPHSLLGRFTDALELIVKHSLTRLPGSADDGTKNINYLIDNGGPDGR